MTAIVEDRHPMPATPPGDSKTIPALLLQHAARRPDAVAMRYKQLGLWSEYSWADYQQQAALAGLGLLELGLEAGDHVAIHSENRPEWVWADVGAQGVGIVSIGVYPTSPAAEVQYLLSHSEAKVVIAEDEEQLDKTMEVRDQLPDLEKIVVIDTRGVKVLDDPMVITWDELMALGRNRPQEEWERRSLQIDPAACAIIVYTSGTTGPPKGAMISQQNMLAVASASQDSFDVRSDDEVLSYLPLCHVAERLFSVMDALYNGYVVNFGEGGESFMADMREVQPTLFLGVPRVWEKMLAGVQIRMADASRLKRTLYRFWEQQGRRLARKRMAGSMTLVDRVLAALGWVMVFRSLRDKLGLRRVRTAISGAAPIAPQVLEFFWAMGVPIVEGYGQTENTALCTYTPTDDVRIGKVGKALPSVEVKIADDGEILTRSPGVFLGYFKNEEATRETITDDGWLRTGDVGELDDAGFLKITDRKKDVIITSGGKNISPSEIENALKVSPYVREAIVIGDQRKFLSALIGIEMDTVGDWATRRNLAFTTYEDLSRKPEVRELIQEWVDEVNQGLAQVEQIKKFEMLPKELDHEEGELTATQKVKRKAISEEFDEIIEGMYS